MAFATRRTFLKAALAGVASLFLPNFLFARRSPNFWFLHTPTGESWPIDDPVTWALANAQQPILERARERLLMLDSSDPHRVIRLVTRRCQLNLVEIQGRRVVVHFWGQQGQGDLRPFFKKHGLARKGIKVALIDRKREVSKIQSGEEFLYGERLPPFWALKVCGVDAYRKKWERRLVEESNDRRAAPWSTSNYCWEGVDKRCIPWRVLKSIWRHETAPLCENCDQPTMLISFGYFVCGFYKRCPVVTRICPLCSRQFEDRSPWDGPKWMTENLDEQHLPNCEISLFGKEDKFQLPWTPEGRAHDLKCRVVDCLNRIDRRGKYGSYFLRDESVVLHHKNDTVTLPPFDGDEDHIEDWCRKVARLMPR